MITKITIDNFQSHQHTELSLSTGVNVLTGQSDSGKTAVLRAIRWVVWNRPSGDAFRSHWGGDTVVGLELDSGVVVERRKGKRLNDYRIFFPKDKSDVLLSAMGQDVPEQVREVLGFSDLNFQLQMDAPFLLSESPGGVARQLNEVADIGKIDTTLANINSMIRANKQELLARGQEASRLEAELVEFRHLDKQLSALSLLQEKERRAGEMEKMAKVGEALTSSHEILQRRFSESRDVTGLSLSLGSVMLANEKIQTLEQAAEQGDSLLSQKVSLEKRLNLLPSEDVGKLIEKLLLSAERAEEAEEQAETLEMKMVVLNEKRDGLASYKLSVNQLEKQWQEQFPDVCPLCGK